MPFDPQAIADWAGAVSFDRFTVNFATIPAAIQTGVNVAATTAVLDDTIVTVFPPPRFALPVSTVTSNARISLGKL